MTVVPSPCLGGCLGVDENGLPANLYDPDGNIECGPDGAREICGQNYLGEVAQAGSTLPGLGAPFAANALVTVTAGLAFAYLTELNWTNPGPCDVRLRPRVDFGIQGVGLALNTQSAPSRIEYQASVNGGPFAAYALVPFTPTLTAPNGWQGETKVGWLAPLFVPAGGTVNIRTRCQFQSSAAGTLDAITSRIVYEAWVVT